MYTLADSSKKPQYRKAQNLTGEYIRDMAWNSWRDGEWNATMVPVFLLLQFLVSTLKAQGHNGPPRFFIFTT